MAEQGGRTGRSTAPPPLDLTWDKDDLDANLRKRRNTGHEHRIAARGPRPLLRVVDETVEDRDVIDPRHDRRPIRQREARQDPHLLKASRRPPRTWNARDGRARLQGRGRSLEARAICGFLWVISRYAHQVLAELNALTLKKAKTENVPVPVALLTAVEEHPEEFGLNGALSRRQKLGELLMLGARAAAANHTAKLEEEYYARLAADAERVAAAEEVIAETRSQGFSDVRSRLAVPAARELPAGSHGRSGAVFGPSASQRDVVDRSGAL